MGRANSMGAQQMALGVQLPQHTTFEAFVGATNAPALAAVTQLIDGANERLFLHGPADAGKSHLLQAACRTFGDRGERSVYIPLVQLGRQAVSLLDGLQEMDCVCIDDVQAIAGDREAEIALLSLTEGLRARRACLLAAARQPPAELGLALDDLASRLGWGGVVALHSPDDEDKQALLVEKAAQRGMSLPTATARYLLRHGPRDVAELIAVLDMLDDASLAAQRRLTIPFVKQTLTRAGDRGALDR